MISAARSGCGKLGGLSFRAPAMLASEAGDRVVRIDRAAPIVESSEAALVARIVCGCLVLFAIVIWVAGVTAPP